MLVAGLALGFSAWPQRRANAEPDAAAPGAVSGGIPGASGSTQAHWALMKAVLMTIGRLGEPADAALVTDLARLEAAGDLAGALERAQSALQTRVLLRASVNPEGQVALSAGDAARELTQGAWRVFLVRLENPALTPGRFELFSPEAIPMNGVYPAEHVNDTAVAPPPSVATNVGDLLTRWLDLHVHDDQTLSAELQPVSLEYKVVMLAARSAGRHAARLRVDVGAGRNDAGERDSLTLSFTVLPACTVSLAVRDVDGTPTTCALLVTDRLGRVYPSQAGRPLPDLYFQPQVYRTNGETLTLPAGDYTVRSGRGPEYLTQHTTRAVAAVGSAHWEIALQRWIGPRTRSWYGVDHHIHAAGCAHYMQPTEGVAPEIMSRQVKGEGLSIGAVLTWGPGYYTQKHYFSGADAATSSPGSKLHYDLEVSGFPSSHCGHQALLQMKAMEYPGAQRIEQWPSSNAPVLRWARSQNAITGYAHSGWGLVVDTTDLPNELMPAFDGIGANDYIVTVTQGLVDFISVCDTPDAADLNIWDHTLNAGLRPRIAGETDWPCIFDEAVGMGRSYVRIDGELSYEAWCRGLKAGRSYVSDGRAHLLDFVVVVGRQSTGVGGADLTLSGAQPLNVQVDAVARLEPEVSAATEALRNLGPQDKPYGHLERSRLGESRRVAVELLINGLPVEARTLEADGAIRRLEFTYTPVGSCWIALRIRGGAHTNPIWVSVAGAPIRVKRSIDWCRQAVDRCWSQKSLRIRPAERAAEAQLYDRARAFYDLMLTEAGV